VRVGVYVDTENITRNGGRSLRYDVLREFACRDGADALRLNSYTSFDEDRAETDDTYQRNVESFHEALRDFGYKVIVKPVKWYVNEDGKRFGKANSDLDMAVDVLLEARNIDRVLLATGDGDFTKVARALQNMGCRVEVVAFDNVSGDLRREADMFVSGYLIPGLLPGESRGPDWGEEGSRVRGLCHWYDSIKGFGFIRYLRSFTGPLWVTDTTREDSPYASTFVHSSELQRAGINTQELPSRRLILEFTLRPSPTKPGELTAQEIALAPRPQLRDPRTPLAAGRGYGSSETPSRGHGHSEGPGRGHGSADTAPGRGSGGAEAPNRAYGNTETQSDAG
jgi:uncharacterized LabA/DUF88 family protein/cold shock CspA family protein